MPDGSAKAKATIVPDPGRRRSELDAIRRELAAAGFEHALGSIAQVVAVMVTRTSGRDYDRRLEHNAESAERYVLTGLAAFARVNGWAGPR